MELCLTPAAQLRWASPDDDACATAEFSEPASVRQAFQRDWRDGLFTLAAERVDPRSSLTLRYWQQLAERYLTALCHTAGDTIAVAAPSAAERDQWALAAPPMPGGEYLSGARLLDIWRQLDDWVRDASAAAGGLSAFLQQRAPQWHQVGRVCFHLAENNNDERRPFAFMATYTEGFGAAGRLKHVPLRNALSRYAGAKNRQALIRLLAPLQQAAQSCDWVKDLVDSGAVYQPLAWPAARAYQLLRSVPVLEASGLAVRLPDWWRKRPRPQVAVRIGERRQSSFGVDALLDFNVSVALGDQPLTDDELAILLDSDEPLVLLRGQWVEVDAERLKQAIAHWQALERQARHGEVSFIEGMRLLAGAGNDLSLDDDEQPQGWAHVEAGSALREVLAALRDPAALDGTDNGVAGLQGTLRPYQRDGVAWLAFLSQLRLGACLADDMGLGKTIQLLALLLQNAPRKKNRPPSLLVLPASLLGNWVSEAARFAPTLRLLVLHPAETERRRLDAVAAAPRAALAKVDLVITSYAMLVRQTWLAELDWQLVILDEAQAIKNPAARQTKAVKKLSAQARIALTGTPVENRLGDLWSLFDFLNPGLLGSSSTFKSFVKRLQQQQPQQFAPLRRLVAPYILRRLKTDRRVINDLPDKIETARYCHLSKPQVKLYQQTVTAMEKALASDAGSAMARRGLVLQTLLRLKQICNHPSQLTGDGDYPPAHSGKFLRLAEISEELASRQQRALIFTQFREIIDPLADYLSTVFGRPGLILHGATGVKKRQALVEQFQRDDGPPFFILSLKAGGTGLNLTAAAHVIHFDRWWNPAVENQATDRAFRIGQRHNVLVHKFITRGTVEERIDALINEKRQLADDILIGDGDGEVNVTELPDDALLQLVRLDITRASEP